VNNYNPNQNYVAAQGKKTIIYLKIYFIVFVFLGSLQSGNPNLFPQNLTNYYNNVFNPNIYPQYSSNPSYNPYLQQQNNGPIGPNGGIGILVSIKDKDLSFVMFEKTEMFDC